MLAWRAGNAMAAEALLARGADPWATDRDGFTGMDLLEREGSPEGAAAIDAMLARPAHAALRRRILESVDPGLRVVLLPRCCALEAALGTLDAWNRPSARTAHP